MKKFLITTILVLVALMSIAVNRTKTPDGIVLTGQSTLSTPMKFAVATDYLSANDTFYINVIAKQYVTCVQRVSVTMDKISGSPSVSIQLQGKVFIGDSYANIGSAGTFTANTDNPQVVTYTTANTMRYFRVVFIATSATQHSHITGFEFQDTQTSGGTNLTGINIGTNQTIWGTTGMTIGTGAQTVAVNSSDWDISATGVMTGIGAITADGLITANNGVTLGTGKDLVGSSTSSILFNTNKFTVAGATGNTVIAGTLGVTGVTTFSASPVFQNGETISNATDGSFIIPNIIRKHTPVAFNSTGTLSAANMLAGVVSCTSTSAVTMTTPTATAIAALIAGAGQGTAFDLIIDNSASTSSGAVTLALDGSIAVVNPAIITGGATLTLAVGTTAKFSFYFLSGTTMKCYRVY